MPISPMTIMQALQRALSGAGEAVSPPPAPAAPSVMDSVQGTRLDPSDLQYSQVMPQTGPPTIGPTYSNPSIPEYNLFPGYGVPIDPVLPGMGGVRNFSKDPGLIQWSKAVPDARMITPGVHLFDPGLDQNRAAVATARERQRHDNYSANRWRMGLR